ncbi:YgcG family protein [Hydrogenophaga sp.]|uniref:TPM domain-containing protein n=1 Tax=Hydrogenophaga sp. TaxID=1904254 RepID=UPI0027229BED|nr:TPM domain-containing protein [Hydrogenophaga sp.]MDO9603939.1 TPM domain-containing protein [Hydrogenophaga sp.]
MKLVTRSTLGPWRLTGWVAALRVLRHLAAAAVLGLFSAGVQAQALLPIPDLRARVMDLTGTLDAASVAAIESKLAAFEAERGSQVVVLMVPTTAPEDIADFTQRLGDAWKIGRRDVGDGVLFVVAKDDRRLRIATSKSLEGAIPDLMARRILDQAVTPAFRSGDYAKGVEAGVDQILARIRGEDLPLPDATPSHGADDFEWMDLLVFLAVAIPIISSVLRSIFGTKLGILLTGLGAGGVAWAISSVLWIAVIAGLLGMLAGLFMQRLPQLPATGRGARGGHWGGPASGGFRGGGGIGDGGGFSSRGGGNFGGGGASGGW